MEEKVRFVLGYEQDECTMTELCEAYGIARETGYVWLRRYRERGLEGLVELNRAALRHGNQTPAETERAVVELRQAHMRWGPRKLKRVLERDQSQQRWPAASTIGELLKREGLVVGRRRRQRTAPYREPLAHADGPNRVWCADFKGWFRTAAGERIDPLTITDAYSRYLLRCQAVEKTDTQRRRAIFEAGFREYGMPQAIRTDNGAPFASSAVGGLSRLSVWWMKLGIAPERIQAGHPEQNGRHERMHRTLKQETAQPAAANRRAQQRAFDRFREEYNEQRPHQALGMQTPALLYEPSPRPYPATMLVRSVHHQGQIRWKKQDVGLSQVLWGERVGLLPVNERWFTIYFAQFAIARFDSQKLKVLPLLEEENYHIADAGEGEASPSPAPHPHTEAEEKLSGMRPV